MIHGVKRFQFSKLMDAYKESQAAVDRTSDKRLDVIMRMQTQRKEALERLATLKKLGNETGIKRE
jgi:hypothetical protein